MNAPSIKEALEQAISQIEYLHEKFSETGSGNAVLAKLRAALATLSPPAGERREVNREQSGLNTFAEMVKAAADTAANERQAGERREAIARMWQDILDKDDRTSPEEYPEMALITFEEFEAAIASGLVQDEAAIRADEREKCVCAIRDAPLPNADGYYIMTKNEAIDAIRSTEHHRT